MSEPAARRRYVYFIQSCDGATWSGPVKIGVSYDPERRIAKLHSTGYKHLRVRAAVVGSFPLERELHRRFAALRLHGEWFSPGAALVMLLEDLGDFYTNRQKALVRALGFG